MFKSPQLLAFPSLLSASTQMTQPKSYFDLISQMMSSMLPTYSLPYIGPGSFHYPQLSYLQNHLFLPLSLSHSLLALQPIYPEISSIFTKLYVSVQ